MAQNHYQQCDLLKVCTITRNSGIVIHSNIVIIHKNEILNIVHNAYA
jgi:hypothetical protein